MCKQFFRLLILAFFMIIFIFLSFHNHDHLCITLEFLNDFYSSGNKFFLCLPVMLFLLLKNFQIRTHVRPLRIKNFPLSFHPNALPAAKAALAANEQGKYIEMVELLLSNGGDAGDAKLKDYAKQLGLNEQKLKDDIKNNDARYSVQIKDDQALGAQVDVRGTPTFYINGKKTSARDFSGFKTEIDALLAKK